MPYYLLFFPLPAHEKTVAFVSHMGMFGFQESVYHRVPLVGIPIFSDQGDNAKRAVEKGLAVEISDKKSFKAQELKEKIETVIYDTRWVKDEVFLW